MKEKKKNRKKRKKEKLEKHRYMHELFEGWWNKKKMPFHRYRCEERSGERRRGRQERKGGALVEVGEMAGKVAWEG